MDHRPPTTAAAASIASRGMLIVVCAIVFGATVVLYAGEWTLNVAVGGIEDAITVALWAGVCALPGYALLRWAKVRTTGAMGFATAAGVGLGVISLATMGLALAGWLNRWTAAGLGAAALAGWVVEVAISGRKLGTPIGKWLRGPAGWAWLWVLAMPFLGIAVLGASIMPGFLWKPFDPHPYDVMVYHLQVPREWYEAGRMTALEHNVYSYFPMGVEMHYLLAMHLRGGPWAAMYLAQFISLMFMVLSIVAVAGVGKEMTGSKAGGVIAGVLAATVPWMTMLGSVAYVEGAFLLYTVLAVGWMWRGMNGETGNGGNGKTEKGVSIRAMAVAGVMAGLACGTKYTAVPAVLLAVPAAGAVAVILAKIAKCGGVDLRRAMLGFVLSIICGLVVFSPWIVRNYAWAGNPVFPLEMRRLGSGGFTAVQVERWERAHRAAAEIQPWPERLKAACRTLVVDWQYGYVVLPLGVVMGLVFWRRRVVWFVGVLLLMQVVYWLALTHLQGRFAVQLVPLAAVIVTYGVARVPAIGAGVAMLAAATGLAGLLPCFSQRVQMARQGLFRLEDMKMLQSPQVARALEDPNAKLAMVGDARAFFQVVPMSRLKYRVIFNIDFEKGGTVLDNWLGQDIPSLQREGYLVLIHPDEVRRLSRTYWAVPKLPAEWEGVRDAAVILTPTGR